MRVQDIAIGYEHLSMSPDDIVYHYPIITLADVDAALTYSYDQDDDFLKLHQANVPHSGIAYCLYFMRFCE
nr:DUF433 domain-containing protein [Neosynechococcus sphagnicola]